MEWLRLRAPNSGAWIWFLVREWGPVIAWRTEGAKVEAVTGFLFLGSGIMVDGDGSHEIRRWSFLAGRWWQTYTMCWKAETLAKQSHSVLSDSLGPPWTVAYEVLPSMEFSRQEYWSGLLFPSPRDLPNPRIESGSPALQAADFTVWALREAQS